MDREQAIELVKIHVKKDFLIKHMLATEAIMKAAAKQLGEDEKLWGLTGLLHDLDFEEIGEDYDRHGPRACEMLEGLVAHEMLKAILSHNYERTGAKPESRMEIALLASDALTGLVVAAALVKGKKLANVTVETLEGCFKKKGFAAGCNRENIRRCEEISIPLDKFLGMGLAAMQGIAGELGL